MTALIGWEEKTPNTVKVGDEVCFSRHVLPRDEDIVKVLSLGWEEYGKPILAMFYGQVKSEPEIIGTRPTTWRVEVEVWQGCVFQPRGFSVETAFRDWDVDGRTAEGPTMPFEFRFDEPLTVVRHDATPV